MSQQPNGPHRDKPPFRVMVLKAVVIGLVALGAGCTNHPAIAVGAPNLLWAVMEAYNDWRK